MYGLNIFAFILFSAINVLAILLCKCSEPTRARVMRVLCLLLLLFNICRYALSPLLGNGLKIPVEFSAFAYFVMPAILLTGQKVLQSWAAYSGIVAGFFYYMVMILAGGPIYNTHHPYDIYISMSCHGTLYLCGLVTISARQYPSKDRYKLLGGVAYVSVHALLLRPLVHNPERLFIYNLLDGNYVRQLLPQHIWNIALPAYYIVMVCFVLLTVKGFFRLNLSQYQKFTALREKRTMQVSDI